MGKIHDLLRYWSSVSPRRFLSFLFRLWKSIAQRIGLSTSSNRHDNQPPDKTGPHFDSRDVASASYVPISRPSREETLVGNASLGPGFSIETGFGLDTNDLSRRISQSPIQSPTSPFSATVACSPRSPEPRDPKSDHTLLPLTPTTPLKSSRYKIRDPVPVNVATIPAGPLAVHRGRQRSLPQDWVEYTHPEGLTYFVDGSRNIRVVTEAYIHDHEIRRLVTNYADIVLGRASSDGWPLNSLSMELLIDYKEEDQSCSYYFADDTDQTIFWLDELSTDSDELCIPDVSGHDHLRIHLHEMYWQHKEYFPVHYHLAGNSEQNLIATLTHNCIDVITATTSTSSYERSQLETMLGVMKSLKHYMGSEGQKNCVIARLWTEIYHTRFINFYGEKNARLFRTQFQLPEEPSSWALKVVFLLLFDAPSTHLATLKDLYVDEVLYSEHWRKFMEALVDDWQDLIFWTTVLLAANMSFLAIFNSPTDVISESRAVTCSIVSTLCSTTSIVIGLMHVRKHRPRARTHATDGNAYLQGAKHNALGFRPLAIIYSLPYAFLMWAMTTFIAAILLYTFNSGLGHSSTFVIGAIAIGLGCILVWAISYFWKDELGIMDDLRGMRGALRWLSPMRLNRMASTVTPRNPDANGPILRHWARRFADASRENETPQGV